MRSSATSFVVFILNLILIGCNGSIGPSSNDQQPQDVSNKLSIQSGTAVANSDGTFVVDIIGTDFSSQSLVILNDRASSTHWISASRLQAAIAVSDVTGATVSAYVKVSSGGLNQSNTVQIEVPPPAIQAGTAEGTSDGTFVTDVTGTGFTPNSVVVLNGQKSPTQWLSASHLQSVIAVATVTGPAFAAYVKGPTKQSNTLQINVPAPTLRYGTAVGTSDGTFVTDIIGTGFIQQSVVVLNDRVYPTRWISPSHLQAKVAISDLTGFAFSAFVKSSDTSSLQSNTIQISVHQTSASTAPAALSFESQVGCENPYVRVNTDWGKSPQFENGAVYVSPIDNGGPLLGSPIYQSNNIFWISRETKPGQSVVMTGAFTSSPKTAKVAYIPDGTLDWRALVLNSTTLVPTVQDRVDGLSFIVPPSFQTGVYGFEIDSPDAEPVFGLANVPSVSWSMGVPSTTDPFSALQHEVHPCGGEPGETLRLFGKNFEQSQNVVLQDSEGNIVSLKPSNADSNSLSAMLPMTLREGTYYVWVGKSSWDATSSQPILITIRSSPNYTVSTFQCNSLSGDGSTDDAANLQSCLDSFAPSPQAHAISLIEIPDGYYVLSNGITLHPYEAIIGGSRDKTQFIGRPSVHPPKAWITVSHHAGIANLSLKAPVNPFLFVTSDQLLDVADMYNVSGLPGQYGDIFLSNVDLETEGRAPNADVFLYPEAGEITFQVSGPDLQIYNSTFSTSHSATAEWQETNFSADDVDGAVIAGNTFVDTDSVFSIGNSQNIIVERNESYSAEGPGPSGGMGFSIARQFSAWYPRAQPMRNSYLGYNYFHDMGWPDQSVTQVDGAASGYFGGIEESDATSITLADDPTWIWTTDNPLGLAVEIVSGKGAGQYSMVKSINGRSIGLMTPLSVIPDWSSIVEITDPKINLIYSHNKFVDTANDSLDTGPAVDVVIEDNEFEDSGRGIMLSAFGPYGGYPSDFGIDILRNNLKRGSGRWFRDSSPNNLAGIGIRDMPGCFLFGILIRDNRVPDQQYIFPTNGGNGDVEIMIEQNDANVIYTWYYPGFIVQNNRTSQ